MCYLRNMDFLSAVSQASPLLFFLVGLWILLWKGLALWKSANLGQRNWFLVILILNGITIGILEIAYLFFFAKKKMKVEELKFWEALSK